MIVFLLLYYFWQKISSITGAGGTITNGGESMKNCGNIPGIVVKLLRKTKNRIGFFDI